MPNLEPEFHVEDGSVRISPAFTELTGAASLAAYTDYLEETNPHYTNPPNLAYGTKPFKFVSRFTGYDTVPWGTGKEERFGLIYQWSAIPDVYLFAFRGTSSVYDMWKDLESAEVSNFSPYRRPTGFPNTVHVGEGFNSIYTKKNASMSASMQDQLFTAVSQLPTTPKTIYITGHSLGCALGSLFALDLAASLPGINIVNFNFASPRVGTSTWKHAYDDLYQLESRTVRIRNDYDLVPKVPFEYWPFDFQHVGQDFTLSFTLDSFTHDPVVIIEAWHSLLNYRYVLQRATPNTPQVWTGQFKDQAQTHPSWPMTSYDPDAKMLDWSTGNLMQVRRDLSSVAKFM